MIFKPHTDGISVFRTDEKLLANVQTKRHVQSGTPEWKAMVDEQIKKFADAGLDTTVARKDLENRGPTFFVPMERKEYEIRWASQPQTVAEIEEVLAGLS